MSSAQSIGSCAVCGGKEFASSDVLWPELSDAWQLSPEEIRYVNRQQGFHCISCRNNLRAMGLARAITRAYGYGGTLMNFCDTEPALKLLEINTAGNLTQVLKKLPQHLLAEYPVFDMTHLDLASESFDLVIHSDTLEHVPNPERGLSECRRVLKNGGLCIFTIPVVVDRMSRSRAGLASSYHGQSGIAANDQVVETEFGADMWKIVLKAGFASCEIFAMEYPAALVLIARK